jgi:sarcosine oxidase subunit beta
VIGIDVSGDRVQGIKTSAGDVATRVVFNCAGAWSGAIGRMAGLEIPVLPYRRHVAVTGAFPAVPRTNPMTIDFQTSLYFHPEGDGVLIGMSDRSEAPGFDTDVSWDFLEKMLEQAARRAPALATAGIKTAWAGLYETTPDHQAILGPVPGVDGVWIAAGFSGHGFMMSPVVGRSIASAIAGDPLDDYLRGFSLGRFARGELIPEPAIV